MYFIITALAAIVSTIICYLNISKDKYKISTLCFIYWGATIMWLVDHVMAYLNSGGEFLEMTLDATLIGITAAICGLFVWIIIIFIKDSDGVIN